MPRSLPARLGLAVLLALGAFAAGCAPPRALSPEDYRARLPALEARAAEDPGDADAQRDLGEAYAQTSQFPEARETLERARVLRPDDPKTLYYLGVSEEGLGQRRAALALFARYEEAPRASPFRRLMEGRHGWLLRDLVREELEALLAAEDSLTAEGVTEAVAVFPLAYQGSDPAYAPLSRGLAEMVTVDLVALGRVRVVERVRLQALLDELALSAGAAFDPATVPRAGMLLRSGRVVGGALDVRAERLRTDVALWEWAVEPLPDLATHQAALEALFDLEKAIVYDLLDRLGVALTAEEQERLDRVPTRDLQAFLAYSRGLLEEDAGRYAGAAALYAEAARRDPGFEEAVRKAAEAAAMAEVDGGVDVALTAARLMAASMMGLGLVDHRLGLLNGSIGLYVVPGDETRDPTSEGPLVPPSTATIPDPPPPPPSGGN
jgi:tetratricopeptide (TPR) repeat protein